MDFTYVACPDEKAILLREQVLRETENQLSLFMNLDILKRTALMRVYDEVNMKMGKDTLRLSVQGPGHKWGQNKEPIAFRTTI